MATRTRTPSEGYVSSPSSATMRLSSSSSGRIVKKYQRLQASSPLKESVRKRLLNKLGQSSTSAIAETDHGVGTLGDSALDVSASASAYLPSPPVTLDNIRVLLSKQEPRGLHVLDVNDVNGTGSSLIVYRTSWLVRCVAAVDGVITYSFQVFFKTIAQGSCEPDDLSVVEGYVSQLSDSSPFVVCPGVQEYPSTIQFKTKNLVVWTEPFKRFFSSKCSQWHIPNNVRQSPQSNGFNCCRACKMLLRDIHQLQQAAESLPDCVREGRLSVNSKYPISKLSPASQMTRLSKSNEQRKHYAKKLKKLGKLDCEVSDKQREELLQLVSAANKSEHVKERLVKGDHTLEEDNNCLKQARQQDLTEHLEYEGINLVLSHQIVGTGEAIRIDRSPTRQ